MTRKLRRSGVPILAALALGAGAQPAAAGTISFGGIGPVDLSMSDQEVRDAIGSPSSTRPHSASGADVWTYSRRKLQVTILDETKEVVSVRTSSRADRTRSGLRVGSTLAAVRSRLRGERCSSAGRRRVCSVDSASSVMDFVSVRGKVAQILVTKILR
jgi:hypothetical protein